MKSLAQNAPLRIIRMIADVLSSREFLVWIVAGWMLSYVSSMIWTKESFSYFMAGLGNSLFIQVPFILFLISGYLNLIKAALHAYKKNKGKLFVWIWVPLGMLLFLSGFFVSASSRHFDWIVAGTGDFLQPKWSQEQYRIDAIDPGVKERFLDIDIDSGKGLFNYEPKVMLSDRNAGTFRVGAFPPLKIADTYYHILNFGLAPGISLSEGDAVKVKGYMALKILRPGDSDSFDIAPLPYRFLLSFEPERAIQKGSLKASEYNLKEPTYKIRVFEGEKVIAEAISKHGIQFKNLTLSFSEPDFWVQLEVVKDAGVPIILSGIFLVAAGIPLFIFGLLLNIFRKNILMQNRM